MYDHLLSPEWRSILRSSDDRGPRVKIVFSKHREFLLTLLHSGDNRSKVVVQQDHVRSVLGSVWPGDPHGDTDISLLESRRVVHAITCYSDDRALGGGGGGWKMKTSDTSLKMSVWSYTHGYAYMQTNLLPCCFFMHLPGEDIEIRYSLYSVSPWSFLNYVYRKLALHTNHFQIHWINQLSQD